MKHQSRGLYVTNVAKCSLCHRDVIVNDPKKAADIIVFNCKHFFHEHCIPENFPMDYCAMCNSQMK